MKNVTVSYSKDSFVMVPEGEAMDGRALYDYQISSLEGKLLTLIETLGLQETQEKAVKDMLKGIVRTALYLECHIVKGEFLNKALRDSNEAMNQSHEGR